jgi:hypothetical protein
LRDAIAIASVCATAAVAIAVPMINARMERARLRGQLQNDRLDELRSVLDLGAVALAQTDQLLAVAELAVERSQATDAQEEDRTSAGSALAEVDRSLAEVLDQQVRTSIRLGPEVETVAAYAEARVALVEEQDILRSAFDGGPSSDDPVGWKEVVSPLYEARSSFRQAQRSFAEMAADLVSPFA